MFPKLLTLLILRNIRGEKFMTVLAITGIALGIGLFTGVKVASDRAVSAFEGDIRGLTPYATHEIFDISGTDFREEIFREVRMREENSFPVLKTFGYLPDLKETIDINGIYTPKAPTFMRVLSKNGQRLAGHWDIDWEAFYRTPNGVLATRKFCERYSLKDGDLLRALVYDREATLTIVGQLDTDILPANTVIMDLGNFQEYFHKTGYLTRIDIATERSTADAIAEILPASLKLERKEEIFENQKALVRSFRYNLHFVSLIAVLVGIFLLYNTVFMSVVKRRTDIGIMRALGADRKTVVLIFTVQGVLFGLIGSVCGIVLGQGAAYFSVVAVEKTISTLYRTIAISDYLLTGRDVFLSLLMGVSISLVASIVPSYEASKIRPHETSREGSFEGRYRAYHRPLAMAGMLCILCGIGFAFIDYRFAPFPFPLFAYGGILFIIGGFTLVSPWYLTAMLKLLDMPMKRATSPIWRLSIGDMRGNTHRFSVALMSVAISSALIISLLIVIYSLRGSLLIWINRNITADVYIKPSSCKANYCFYPISDEVVQIVSGYPEVDGVDRFRALHLDLFGKKVIAGFADVDVKRKFLHRKHPDRRFEGILSGLEADEPVVDVSDYLAAQHRLTERDSISIATPIGPVKFRINDISSSYSTTSGFLYFHRKWLTKYWGLDDTTQMSLYLRPGTDVDGFIARLKSRLLPHYALEIMNNGELRNRIMDIFNKSFAITYAIEIISIVVSLIGVVTTLLSLVIERRREISILRYVGTDWRRIRHAFMLSAGCTGVAGIALGTVLGLLMSIILIKVVNTLSFGWEIRFTAPLHLLAVLSALIFVTTLFAGYLPAVAAKKIDPKRFVSFE